MRRLTLVLAVLAMPAVSAQHPPVLTLVDWQEGQTLAPTSPFVTPPLADAFAFDAIECYPHIGIDLLYEPDELVLDAGVGEAAIAYEFRVEVWHNGSRVFEDRVQRSGYSIPIGSLEALGPHELRLSLGWGAAVEWDMRLRGRLATENPACLDPIE